MDGTTEPFYIFTGEEFEVQRAYINRIAQSKNQIVKRVDTIAEATKGRSGGLLGQSVCYVCRDDSDFQKNESAWDKIETLLNGNTLIYQTYRRADGARDGQEGIPGHNESAPAHRAAEGERESTECGEVFAVIQVGFIHKFTVLFRLSFGSYKL